MSRRGRVAGSLATARLEATFALAPMAMAEVDVTPGCRQGGLATEEDR